MEYDHQKVDAAAQQADSGGASENLRRVGSCCISGTDVFEKIPFYFFGRRVFQKWMQLRNRHFRRDPHLFKEGLETDATAEQIFLERPPSLFWRRVFQKWMQLRNRHFRRDLLIFKEGLEADATAEQMFLKRPPQFFLKSSLLKVDATAQQAFSKGPFEYPRRSSGC